MGRGANSLAPEQILYGSVASRNREIDLTADSLNPETSQYVDVLIAQLEAGDVTETLKTLNQYRQQWEQPGPLKLALSLAEHMVHGRYPELGRLEHPTEVSSERTMLVYRAYASLCATARTKRITTKDIRELFFETEAFTQRPANPDPELRQQLLRVTAERIETSLTRNRADRWLDEGMIPMLRKSEELGLLDTLGDLQASLSLITNHALAGRHKAMQPWSQGYRGWVSDEQYLDRFYQTMHGRVSGFGDDEGTYQTWREKIKQSARDDFPGRLRDQIRSGEVESMLDIAHLAQRSLGEACVKHTLDDLRERPLQEIFGIFKPSPGCDKPTRDSCSRSRDEQEDFPEAAVIRGLRAYHRLDSSIGDYRNGVRMTKAFVAE